MGFAKDHEVIQALPPDALDPAFGHGIQVRRPRSHGFHLDAFGLQGGVAKEKACAGSLHGLPTRLSIR
jgi:hypothetical protein